MKNICMICLISVLFAGCTKTPSPSAGGSSTTSAPPPGVRTGDPRAAGQNPDKKVSRPGGLFGVPEQTKNFAILRNIGVACKVEDISRLPKTIEEIKAIAKEDAKAVRALENGEFVLAPNARVAGDSLFLYERDPDGTGSRLVLMGDGSVHKKSAAEFAALQKQGSP
jgi:hypothetical protein